VLWGADKTLDDLYSLGKRVGAGNFGEVFFATSMLDGSKVAVKRVKKSRLITSEEMESISREVCGVCHLRPRRRGVLT
jgi:serine/threonine protein kinase